MAASTTGKDNVRKQVPSASMITLINCRVEITMDDNTLMVGKLLSYDAHQNMILGDAERVRTCKKVPEKTLRAPMGLAFIRGKCVVGVVFKPSITTKSHVIDSRTDGRAAEARRLAAKRTSLTTPLDVGAPRH